MHGRYYAESVCQSYDKRVCKVIEGGYASCGGYGIFSQEISQNLHVCQRVGEVKKPSE